MSDGLIEVRGVVAMNGLGQLCFFARSRDEGLPILDANGAHLITWLSRLPKAIAAAPVRRVSYADLALLDPTEAS